MQIFQLSNGLRVAVDTVPARSVAVGLWVKTGAVCESGPTRGMSHFIEHMLFKGTNKRTAQQLAEEMDGVGGQMNAFTAKECTCFHVKVMDAHLPIAMELLSDMLLDSAFAEEEMQKEKGVVLEEVAMVQDTPEELVHDLAYELYYGSAPMGNPILGTRETVSAYTRSGLLDYMRQFYVPENAVLALAGNVTADAARELAERYFGSWFSQKGFLAAETNYSANGSSKTLLAPRDAEQVHTCIVLPGVGLLDGEQYTGHVLNNILGGTMSSRLFQHIREEQGLAYSVYSYLSSAVHSGMNVIYTGTNKAQTRTAVSLIMDELTDLRAHGVKEEEFVRAREQLKGSFVLGREGVGSHMMAMGRGLLLTGNVKTEDETLALIDAVTVKRVNDMAAALYTPENLQGAFSGAVQGLEPEKWF